MPLRPDSDWLDMLARYRASGVHMVSLNIGYGDTEWPRLFETLLAMRERIATRPDAYRLISSMRDIEDCRADGCLGIVFDVEGMAPVEDDLDRVDLLYDHGVRWMLIAYNCANRAGGGCLDAPDRGLSEIGRAIIDRMELAGMVLCLSHAGERTVRDALDHCSNPPIFSHSNPFAHTPHPRNISDDMILACARKGGVIGLSGIGPFLDATHDLVPRLIEQIRHVVDRVGARHVGLGLDHVFDRTELASSIRTKPGLFPAVTKISADMAMIPPEATGTIIDQLQKAKFDDADIRGILGENWQRVAGQVWRDAPRITLADSARPTPATKRETDA